MLTDHLVGLGAGLVVGVAAGAVAAALILSTRPAAPCRAAAPVLGIGIGTGDLTAANGADPGAGGGESAPGHPLVGSYAYPPAINDRCVIRGGHGNTNRC